MKKLSFTLVLVLLLPLLSQGWGIFGHRTIAQISVYALPKPMQGFYYRHLKELVKKSTAADERRETDPAEASKHFIDMDYYGEDPFNTLPKTWDQAAAKYPVDTLRKHGTVPWTVLDLKEQLTEAFRQGDTTAIINLSADLGHYIADAYVPLHTTLNYDGQLTNQEGMHSLWESKLPERNIAKYKLDSDKAKYVKDPLTAIWKAVQESYGFLGATFDFEEALSRSYTTETKYTFSHRYGKTRRSYSDAFADAYHEKVGGMVAYRLKQAPTLVASMWYTAWKDGGSPDLDKLLPHPVSKAEREQLAADLTLWDDNQLVAQQRLLALEKDKVVERPDQINAAREMPAAAATEQLDTPASAAPPAAAPAPDKAKVKAKASPAAPKPKAKPKKADDGWGDSSGSGW